MKRSVRLSLAGAIAALAMPASLLAPTTATAETSSTTQTVTASKAATKKVSAGLTKADLAEIKQVEARNKNKNKINSNSKSRSTDAASRSALPPLRVVYNSRGSNRGELIASRTRGRGSLDIVSRGEVSEFGGYSIKQNAGCQLWIGSLIHYRATGSDHWRTLPPAWEIWTKTRCPAGTESW